VEVNLIAVNWTCSDNIDYCPGLGGFRYPTNEFDFIISIIFADF
jgi:hypothetical protein